MGDTPRLIDAVSAGGNLVVKDRMDIFIGFDSAWADNARAPGAICAVGLEGGVPAVFHRPRLVSFSQALAFIEEVRSPSGVSLVALDQPTLVPNATSMRPVERAAASLISWMGGGAQPANRGRTGMFCKAAPVWRFLTSLGAEEDPERARDADDGLFIMEVFPALALASLGPGFFGRLAGPRYNPGRAKTFRAADWVKVAETAAAEASAFGCVELAGWCREAGALAKPRKADQDMLDAALCTLIALRWRLRARQDSLLLGDLTSGYMVLPASQTVRERLTVAAMKCSVPVDGVR